MRELNQMLNNASSQHMRPTIACNTSASSPHGDDNNDTEEVAP